MSSDNSSASAARIQATLKRGFKALSEGRLDEATHCCRTLLSWQPKLVQGHFLVGLTALEAGDRRTAFSAFGSVTKLDKDHAAAWANLAKLFTSEGQVARADAALANAVAANPSQAIVCDLIGVVFSQLGEYDTAQHWFERACAAKADHPPYLLNLANNWVYRGKIEQAQEMFRRIIALQEDSPQAHWSLAAAHRAQNCDHIDQMTALVQRPDQHPRVLAFYHYAIGKEYEDLQQWDPAFEALACGARLRRDTVEYDETSEVEMFAWLEKHYDKPWLSARKPVVKPDNHTPIFILGQPRTGTTLIERIISSHSQVTSAGELQQFGLAMRRLSDYRDPRRFSAEFFAATEALDFANVGQLYLDSTRKMQGDTPYFVDKLPQNYLMLPHILKALPGARIIHLTRGAMDACFSSYKQLFADAYLHSYDQQEMARHHSRYRQLMQVWRERFGEHFLDVSYENVAIDFDTNVRRILDYLGLPFEQACLNFHQQSGAVSTASAVQVREPIHTRSIDRWKRYARQLAPMQEELLRHGVPLSADERVNCAE